jgi:hypothetical protein
MKTLQILIILLIVSISGFAQNGINYKAVIKNDLGNVIANSTVDITFQILESDALTNVYEENHSPTTDDNGIIIANIGEGTIISGIFNDINWGEDNHYLNVKIDTGSGFIDMGTTQFYAIPYAFHAKKAANVKGLEAINEGFGIGWRLIGRNPDNYGNIGGGGIDLSLSTDDTQDYGATGTGSFTTGFKTIASGGNSTAMGNNTAASGIRSTTMGLNTTASGGNSIAMGESTTASGIVSTAMGKITTASGENSTAMGENTIASGENSTALGRATEAIGENSVAMGGFTEASGDFSFAFGNGSEALGNNSIAMGDDSFATSDYATAIGRDAFASGQNALALGYNTEASGEYSTAMGRETEASAENAIAMGQNTVASGNLSTSMGQGTIASGVLSTSMGSFTTASGVGSTAMGRSTIASGLSATAMGGFTNASAFRSTAIGSYNIGGGSPDTWVDTDPLFEIGNGDYVFPNENRNNALTVLKNGNIGIGTHTPLALVHILGGQLRIGTETIEDTGSNRLSFNADLLPDVNNAMQLGSSGFRWQGLWATDGTINTSDRRDKTNIKTINYGLNEVLKMNPVSFNWKHRKNQDTKLGLIAQDLLELVPEVVMSHEWKTTSEDKNATLEKVELDRLGVYYSDLIPVLINAIKEQQQIIDNEKLINAKQSSQLEALLSRVEQLESKKL